jgi:hypothetical protein
LRRDIDRRQRLFPLWRQRKRDADRRLVLAAIHVQQHLLLTITRIQSQQLCSVISNSQIHLLRR